MFKYYDLHKQLEFTKVRRLATLLEQSVRDALSSSHHSQNDGMVGRTPIRIGTLSFGLCGEELRVKTPLVDLESYFWKLMHGYVEASIFCVQNKVQLFLYLLGK